MNCVFGLGVCLSLVFSEHSSHLSCHSVREHFSSSICCSGEVRCSQEEEEGPERAEDEEDPPRAMAEAFTIFVDNMVAH